MIVHRGYRRTSSNKKRKVNNNKMTCYKVGYFAIFEFENELFSRKSYWTKS